VLAQNGGGGALNQGGFNMKQLLATTALAFVLLAGDGYAANTPKITTYQQQPTDIQASKFIGMRVYATERDIDPEATAKSGSEKEWDDIGEINEVILSREGDVRAVVVGVGGFLGIGEKNLAVPMKQIKFVKNGDDADDYFLVINANKQMLTDAPAYASVQNTTEVAKTPESTTSSTPETRTALVRPDVKREGYRQTETAELTSETLTGARVYGAKDEDVGEVDKLILNPDGTVKQLVLDIGGFLGIGEHRIAVGLDEVNIVRNEKGDDVRVYVNSDKETLKAVPAYNG
jgi:sporulation protein YlmC with PRC-barrel domain